MSFVSYAQNFEDVMLWRALGHVENGTYVDVGAQDPLVDSVSRAFYEHGWRGVHVEPVPYYAERLRQDRPGETVLQAALGATNGTLALTVIPGTGLSTAVQEHAQRHHEAGFDAEETHVPLLTLTSALGMLAGREVHWLKIDVEGFEEAVLKGWDSRVLRPWVMVIEATVPGSTQTDYEGWEPIVLAGGYRFVYFDGLNRFYVAQEHAELAAAFATPPNVFDAVQLSGLSSWGLYRRVEAAQQALAEEQARTLRAGLAAQENLVQAERERTRAALAERDAAAARLEAASAQLGQLRAQVEAGRLDKEAAQQRIAAMHAQIHDWWSVADRLNQENQALRASTSWRLTAPLRAFKRELAGIPNRLRRGAGWGKRGLRIAGRPVLLWTMRGFLARPGLSLQVARLLTRFPRLKHYLRQFAGRAGLIAEPAAAGLAPEPANTSPMPVAVPPQLGARAGRIYKQLRRQQS